MMSKSKKMELPTVDDAAIDQQEIVSEQLADAASAAPPARMSTQTKSVSVPLASTDFGYLPRQIYLRKLTAKQSGALRQLQEALCIQGVRLADGSAIKNPANAIKWLLESVAAT
jgi:hypothetical protein